jgi:predicted AlkP superfamily pyrophosphatase or phosphodiesterase
MFWWYNMYAGVDYSVTPRPMYPADGRKLPDIHAHPSDLRDTLNSELGTFPLFNFWGPTADIVSSRWIADATLYVYQRHHPTLTFVYLPHLDYCLQKLGPRHPDVRAEVRAVDALCGDLIERARRDETRIIVLSEYGITEVSGSVSINRTLREHGFLRVRSELGRELLDPGASSAFAVADHQLAHVYVADPELVPRIKELLESLPGVETVLDEAGKREMGLGHPRSGELVAIARSDHWFTYYYWFDDDRAPDFARTVDIHRKPGYDPVELFLDPRLLVPPLQVGWRLLKKMAGFRYLMDVIPLDPTLVKGSHGRVTDNDEDGPVFITSDASMIDGDRVAATDVKRIVLDHVFDRSSAGDRPLK